MPDTAKLRREPRPLETENREGAAPAPSAPADRPRHGAGDAYSRRVALLKRVLPAVGVGLLLLVAAWPRLEPVLDSVRLGLPMVDRRDARELQIVNPRYAGIDRLNRPYVLTAAAGRQTPEHSELMSLDRPRGRIIVHGGAEIVLTALTGIYQTEARLLDLFDQVTLTHSNGTRFVTRSAHLDLAAETASGHDPVDGRGPSGDITAEGFRVADKGDTIDFIGPSHLLLKQVTAVRPAPPPPALPARVEQSAARLAAGEGAPMASAGKAAAAKPHAARRAHAQTAAARSKMRRHGE